MEVFALVLSALGPLSNAAGGPKQLKELLGKIDPVAVVVRDSVQVDEMYVVTVVFQNRTAQGIYLESITPTHPKRRELNNPRL